MEIREMQVADISQIKKIANASYETTYRIILPVEVQRDFLNLAYGTERLIQRMNSSLFLVCIHEGILKGFANFSRVNRQGNSELLAIYMEEQYQRQNIGSSFILFVKKQLRGLKSVTINLEADNLPACSFATKQQFSCIEEFVENFQGVNLHMRRYELFIQENK